MLSLIFCIRTSINPIFSFFVISSFEGLNSIIFIKRALAFLEIVCPPKKYNSQIFYLPINLSF